MFCSESYVLIRGDFLRDYDFFTQSAIRDTWFV